MRGGKLTALVAIPLAASAALFSTGAAAPSKAPTNQCAVPSTQRVGGWVCTDPAASRAKMERRVAALRASPQTTSSNTTTTTKAKAGTVQRAVPTIVESTSGDGKTGWCSVQGCWYLYRGDQTTTTYHAAGFDLTGFYGYGDTTIGSIDIDIYDYLPDSTNVKLQTQHAHASAARPYNVWWASNLLVNGNYPSGTACGTATQSASVAKAAGLTASYDNVYIAQCIYSTQATQHTFYWKDYNYPGRWYHFQKLAKFTHELGYQSHYLGDWDTPQAPTNNAGWGYNP